MKFQLSGQNYIRSSTMIRKPLVVVLIALFFLLLIGPTVAQDATESAENVIAEGLNFPRGIVYDADGNLYIAESGAGGDLVMIEQEGVQITGGLTGQVSKIAS